MESSFKKVAFHQPYFFPYIGYYSIMNEVDYFAYADEVQYIKRGWINRNRILSSNGGWTYINVPTRKNSQKTPINEILIDNDQDWKRRLFSQLEVYRKAPYYEEVISLIRDSLSNSVEHISELNNITNAAVCEYLNIDTEILNASDVSFNRKAIHLPDEWGLEVTKALINEGIYINAPNGKAFYSTKKYKAHGVELRFMKNNLREYKQLGNQEFIPGLSIIDVMMFNSVEEIRSMLQDYTYI